MVTLMSPNIIDYSLIKEKDSGMPLKQLEHMDSKDKEIKDIEKLGKELEGIFINYLLKAMRSTIIKSDFMHKDKADEFYTAMYDEYLSNNLIVRSPIGISKLFVNKYLENTLQHGKISSGKE